MNEATTTANVGVILGLAQYWSSLVGAFGVGALIWLAKRYAMQQDERATKLELRLEARAEHLDACIDRLQKDVQRNHDTTSSRLSVLETWRAGRDLEDLRRYEEWREHMRHLQREQELATERRHELDNRINALGLKIAVLDRRIPTVD